MWVFSPYSHLRFVPMYKDPGWCCWNDYEALCATYDHSIDMPASPSVHTTWRACLGGRAFDVSSVFYS